MHWEERKMLFLSFDPCGIISFVCTAPVKIRHQRPMEPGAWAWGTEPLIVSANILFFLSRLAISPPQTRMLHTHFSGKGRWHLSTGRSCKELGCWFSGLSRPMDDDAESVACYGPHQTLLSFSRNMCPRTQTSTIHNPEIMSNTGRSR